MRWSPIVSLRNADLRRYLWLSLPIMIGFSIVAVDEWIVKNQASYLPEGTLAYLQYGRTLMKVPIGMFGMAAGCSPARSDDQPYGVQRPRGRGLQPAEPWCAAYAGANLRRAGMPDTCRLRGDVLDLGSVL